MRRRLAALARRPPVPEEPLLVLTDEDRRYLTTLHDDSVPLPPGTAEALRPDHPALAELEARYAALDHPALAASRWSAEHVEAFLDLAHFRGETLITWHYRELPRITRLKYFVWARHVAERDPRGLLGTLGEDGAFGCWTFTYPGWGRVSRDLLESVTELAFLDRRLGLCERERFSVIDVGAGYGRLAHRMVAAHPGRLTDYVCTDAVAASSFVCDHYLRHRGVAPPARVVPLDAVEELAPGAFDLAVNVHSFSECTQEAIAWWLGQLARFEVEHLLLLPNEPEGLLSLEPDGSRRPCGALLERAGFELVHREPVIDDPAVAELVGLHDVFEHWAARR